MESIKLETNRLRDLALAALLVVTVVAFSPLLSAKFVNWDDPITIQHNLRIFPATLHGLGENWSQTQGHLYVPVTYTAWWLAALIARQPAAVWFHGLNVLIHLFTVVAIYALLRLLGFSRFATLAGAGVFALHPVQVEAVAWCSGTKDLLAGALGLWAIYLAGRKRMVIATILFALALLAKPSALVFPIIAAILLPRFLGRRRAWILAIIWAALAIPVVVVGRLVQPAQGATFTVPLYARPWIALDAIGFYLQKILWPIRLATDYGHSPLQVLTTSAIQWRVAIVLVLAAIVWLLRRKFFWLGMAALLFVVALLPMLGLIPFDFQSYSTTADHYLYVPMFGVAVAVTAMARYRVLRHLILALVIVLGLRTAYQCGYWNDNFTLYAHDIRVNPRSQAAHVNLGIAFADAGAWQEADQQYHDALRLNFANSRAQLGVGRILALRGETQAALGHLRAAARLESDDPLVHYDLAVALASMNESQEALTEYEKSLAIEPNFAAGQTNLGTLLLSCGDLAGAEMHYRAALRIDPSLELPKRGLEEIARRRHRH